MTLGSASTISAISSGRAIHLTHTGNLDNAGFDLTLGLANGSLAGSIVGGGGLIKSGIGTWVLTGNSTYTGATTINVGTLQIGNGGTTGALPAASAVAFGTGGSPTPSLIFNRADGATVSNTIGNTSGATISNVAYGSTLNLSGATLTSYTGTYTATLNEAVSATRSTSTLWATTPVSRPSLRLLGQAPPPAQRLAG
ncbi:MAG: hypothetical protein EBT33_22365 [Betaproteobacteria bacterium]|nr:hypothetical protein [Betaproteobacteria bacterium]